MTPAARFAAAIEILDRVLVGEPAEAALIRWARASRYAGSGDRAGVRDMVYDALRRLRSRAALGGAMTGRGIMLGICREQGMNPAMFFTGERHAALPLSIDEIDAGRQPQGAETLDLPDWIVSAWNRALQADAAPIADLMRDRAPVWLRVNTLRGTVEDTIALLESDGITVERTDLLAIALRVAGGSRKLTSSRAYRQGHVELQDLSPQLACAAIPVTGSVLDFCAGGGGKALALAARGHGPVTAHDGDSARMADLPARAKRAGAQIRIAEPGRMRGQFDLVVTDVPCSGSGTWRRNPDAKWRLTSEGFGKLLTLQAKILDEAAGFVRPQGHLAYMTCSLLDEENGDQLAAFLVRHPRFEIVQQQTLTPLTASDGFHHALLRRC